jgi:putative transposase
MLKIVENEAVKEEGYTLDALAREGARRMLMSALEEEVAAYVERHVEACDAEGRRLVVRNGQARARGVTCGAGTLEVRAPRVNDRRVDEEGERCRFTSRILPPYMRRSPKVAEVLPVLYLRGLSTGDFRPALETLLGEEAAGLSATNIARLTGVWEEEYREFRKRRLEDRDYVYVWADGVHFNVRLEDERLCTLVLIGARADGQKELIAVEDGYRESAESWKSVLRDLKRRGMQAPVLAVGDGALGFWEAVREVWPATREQRDWCHKIANVLDKLPKRLQGRAKRTLHEIMYAETRAQAEQGIEAFVAEFSAQIREGSRLSHQGPRSLARLLRLPGRALEASADEQPHRVELRDRAAPSARDQRRGQPGQGTDDGIQAPDAGAGALAQAEWHASATLGACRCTVRRWCSDRTP